MQERPIRILHVLGGMNRGGVETWLMHVLRHIDRQQFQMDFLVHTDEPCAYDAEIRALGSTIIPCLHPSRPLQYLRSFGRILDAYGPYDVVHSHVHHFSGYVLSLAQRAGVPVRIAHSHSDITAKERNRGVTRSFYHKVTAYLITRFATVGLACSGPAATSLFGSAWQTDPRRRLFYCGIDLNPFRQPVDGTAVRAELGIAPDAFVIGHVGRFVEPKNHTFLLDIAAEVVCRAPKTQLLLVGDGALRAAMEAKAHSLSLEKNIVFVGVRPDIPRLMRAMDLFLFPSLFEGLPVTLLEAQAAGLPYLASDVITPEVEWISGLGRRLGLTHSAVRWAEEVLAVKATFAACPANTNLTTIEQSPFNIRSGVKHLERIYARNA